MIDWVFWLILVLSFVTVGLLTLLLVVLSRIASMVMGLFGGESGGIPDGLKNMDMEKVIANLLMQGGSQLLSEAKSQKGGLLGMFKEAFTSKDKTQVVSQLDQMAVKPGELHMDKVQPAQNPLTAMLGVKDD